MGALFKAKLFIDGPLGTGARTGWGGLVWHSVLGGLVGLVGRDLCAGTGCRQPPVSAANTLGSAQRALVLDSNSNFGLLQCLFWCAQSVAIAVMRVAWLAVL